MFWVENDEQRFRIWCGDCLQQIKDEDPNQNAACLPNPKLMELKRAFGSRECLPDSHLDSDPDPKSNRMRPFRVNRYKEPRQEFYAATYWDF